MGFGSSPRPHVRGTSGTTGNARWGENSTNPAPRSTRPTSRWPFRCRSASPGSRAPHCNTPPPCAPPAPHGRPARKATTPATRQTWGGWQGPRGQESPPTLRPLPPLHLYRRQRKGCPFCWTGANRLPTLGPPSRKGIVVGPSCAIVRCKAKTSPHQNCPRPQRRQQPQPRLLVRREVAATPAPCFAALGPRPEDAGPRPCRTDPASCRLLK